MHSPHQIEKKYIDMYKGKFDMGKNVGLPALLAAALANDKSSGCFTAATQV